jgi:hypothetical protein
MADFRSAPGRSPQWIASRGSFSNFEFVDQHFGSHSILRRIFSLARKLNYGGFLIEQIGETDCSLLADENRALALRLPDFNGSTVTRFLLARHSLHRASSWAMQCSNMIGMHLAILGMCTRRC